MTPRGIIILLGLILCVSFILRVQKFSTNAKSKTSTMPYREGRLNAPRRGGGGGGTSRHENYDTASNHLKRRDDDEAWSQMLGSLSFLSGPYKLGKVVREIVDILPAGEVALWDRLCGSANVDKEVFSWFEDCDSYQSWDDVSRIHSGDHALKHITAYEAPRELLAPSSQSDTLIAVTVSDQLATTIACLESLRVAAAAVGADIVVIDDHSVDGTEIYLRKRGYFVVSRPKSTGLSVSWNVAYDMATTLGYHYLFIVNNDIIVPVNALKELRTLLARNAMVIPTTTLRGAGHNAIQNLLATPNHQGPGKESSLKTFRSFVSNPRNAHVVQESLKPFSGRIRALTAPLRFNGFFFGLNLTAAHQFSFDPHSRPLRLLDEAKVPMVGQEQYLTDRMTEVCLTLREKWGNVTSWDANGHPLAPNNAFERQLPVPILALGAFVFHFKSVTLMEGLNRHSLATNASGADPCSIKTTDGKDIRDDFTLFHAPQSSHPAASAGADVNYNYPWLEALKASGPSSVLTEPLTHPPIGIVDPKLLTLAFVVSNPATNAAAGDVFTANELADAMQQLYPGQLRVVYLFQGPDWYNASKIAEVDILISLLDIFNLGRALSAIRPQSVQTEYATAQLPPVSAKRTLITIGWARNWFKRWISRPWSGHWDLLLVSSATALNIFQDVVKHAGLPLQCLHRCPSIGPQIGSSPQNRGYRRPVRTGLLLLASNTSAFDCRLADVNAEALPLSGRTDYLLPVSYHNQSRAVMALRPSVLSPYRGRLIGSNWNETLPKTSSSNSTVRSELVDLWAGARSYHELPSEYCQTSVIIDDANFATKSWGSVNSRVFDGLASGRLVVTDGFFGSSQVFGDKLPHWNSSSDNFGGSMELRSVLERYLKADGTPTPAYREATSALAAEVREKHSYVQRAREFGGYLQTFGVVLTEGAKLQPEQGSMQTRRSSDEILAGPRQGDCQICVGIRAMPKHYKNLPILLSNLLLQHGTIKTASNELRKGQSGANSSNASLGLHLFVVETQNPRYAMRKELETIVDDVNARYGAPGRSAHVFYDPLIEAHFERQSAEHCSPMGKVKKNDDIDQPDQLYGYEETDALLAYLLRRRKDEGALRCDWLLFTNGDNMFNSAWLDAVAAIALKEPKRGPGLGKLLSPVQIIAWNFVTHHKRATKRGLQPQQVINVDLNKRGFVDLSSFMFRSSLAATTRATFLPGAPYTQDLFARDFFFSQLLIGGMRKKQNVSGLTLNSAESGIAYIPQCLLFHQ
jgi:hypothetical protein